MNNVQMMAIRPLMVAMLERQDALNSRVDPDWVGTAQPFWRALWVEAGEAMGYLRWEWWKNVDPNGEAIRDRDQFYLEVADMLHFSLSQLIIYCEGDIERAADRGIHAFQAGDAFPRYDVVGAVEIVCGRAIEGAPALAEIAALAKVAGLGIGGLALFYFGKNVLNDFRQRNGYKEGIYRKMWSEGCEDNVYLARMLNEVRAGISDDDILETAHTEETRETIYQMLDKTYQAVIASS